MTKPINRKKVYKQTTKELCRELKALERPKHITEKDWKKGLINKQNLRDLAHKAGLDIEIPIDWIKTTQFRRFKTTCQTCGFKKERDRKSIARFPFCTDCNKKRKQEERNEKRRQEYLDIIKKVLETYPGSECLTPLEKIKGERKEKVIMRCDQGHEWNPRISNLRITPTKLPGTHNQWCHKCYYKTKFNKVAKDFRENSYEQDFLEQNPKYYEGTPEYLLEQVRLHAEAMGCKLLTTRWLGQNALYKFKCLYCEKIFEKKPRYLMWGRKRGDPEKSNQYLMKNGWCSKQCLKYHLIMNRYREFEQLNLPKKLGMPYDVNQNGTFKV